MKISVTEALRLKKEMASLVSKWQRDTGNIQFGTTTQNGVVVSGTNDLTIKFGDYIKSLDKLLKYNISMYLSNKNTIKTSKFFLFSINNNM